MKAIGAKNTFILGLFLSEALLIGLIGSTLAILVGGGGAYIMTDFAPRGPGGGGGAAAAHVTPIFIPHDILNVWILSVVLSLAAGLFPAWKASRLSPLEALRR
jgi:putative ABC transport system permease protein